MIAPPTPMRTPRTGEMMSLVLRLPILAWSRLRPRGCRGQPGPAGAAPGVRRVDRQCKGFLRLQPIYSEPRHTARHVQNTEAGLRGLGLGGEHGEAEHLGEAAVEARAAGHHEGGVGL